MFYKFLTSFLIVFLGFLITESRGSDEPIPELPYRIAATIYSRLIIPPSSESSDDEISFDLHEIVKIAQNVMGMVEVPVTVPRRKPDYNTYEEQIEGEFERLTKTWYAAAARHFCIDANLLKRLLDTFYEVGPNPILMSRGFREYEAIMRTIKGAIGGVPRFIGPDYDPHILPEYIEPDFSASGWLWVGRYLAITPEPISGWWIRIGGRFVRIKNFKKDKEHLYISDHGVGENILHDTKQDFLVFNHRSHDSLYVRKFCTWFSGLSDVEIEFLKKRFFLLLYKGQGGTYCKNELLCYVLALPSVYRPRVLAEGRLDIPFYNVGTSIGIKEKASDPWVEPLSPAEDVAFSSIPRDDLEEYELTFQFTLERLRFRGNVQVPIFFGDLFGRSGGRVGLSPFFTQIDQMFHAEDAEKFKTFYTLKELKKRTSGGLQEFMFRPLHSFGQTAKGPSYNDFSKALKHYRARTETPVPDMMIATYMRHVLRGGRLDNPELYFIPSLCAVWFTGEIARNNTSLLTNLILLDFMELGIVHLNNEGHNLYSLRHLLVHPQKPTNSLDRVPILDMYGDPIDLAEWDGMHPMAHGGSVPGSKRMLDKTTKLTTVRQKEGHLLIHWLVEALNQEGIGAYPKGGLLVAPHSYEDIDKLFNPSKRALDNIKDNPLQLRRLEIAQKIKELLMRRANTLDNLLSVGKEKKTGTNSGTGGAVEYEGEEVALKASLKDGEKAGAIEPRTITGWGIYDVEDRGNCFYDAVVHQLQLHGHPFIGSIPVGTNPRDSLRLQVQGEAFRDREWADDPTIEAFLRKFPDYILAVVDTRHPDRGFTCYFVDSVTREIITYIPGAAGILPAGRTLLRIAATGNHFMSVQSHPALVNGLIQEAWSL
ncbi:MAG: hypothetical protein K2Y08_03095 [Alphaproteobacteria bacterium]|nr:hypothetical protein [Alphaproteobacteria bacterium]